MTATRSITIIQPISAVDSLIPAPTPSAAAMAAMMTDATDHRMFSPDMPAIRNIT